MATPSYIPNTDGDFSVWINSFSTNLSADPTSYGISEGQATDLAALVTTWNAAYAAALDGATRGPTTVAAKDTARANAQLSARQTAQMIQANPGITDEQKSVLRITLRKTNKTPIPAPTTSPLLSFIAATPGQHTLNFADQLTPHARTKPFGAAFLMLRVWVNTIGVTPIGTPSMQLTITRSPVAIDFATDQMGKQASYVAAWVNAKGEEGPDSNGIAAAII